MISTLLILAAAAPQSTLTTAAMPGPARFGGTYHVASGTWQRGRAAASRGVQQVLYDNTAQSGYFTLEPGPTSPFATDRMIDEGILPGSTHPGPFPVAITEDVFAVGGVSIGYCDLDPRPQVSGWQLDFYESYAPCLGAPSSLNLNGTISVQGAPSNGCWVIDVDLAGASFSMVADGGVVNFGHQGNEEQDSFGVALRYAGSGTRDAGPIIAGDPLLTDPGWSPGSTPSAGAGTFFGPTGGCPGRGTGLGNSDRVFIQSAAYTGCTSFGGYENAGSACDAGLRGVFGGFHLEMRGGAAPGGGGVTTISGCTGFVNATGVPGELEAFGSSVAADNRVVLFASELPPDQFGLFSVGTESLPPGVFNSGNGTLCINPSVGGGLGRFMGPGQIKNTGPTGTASLSTASGEWTLARIPDSLGTYAALPGTTNHFQFWHREPVGFGFNFTGSAVITWQ